MIGHGSYMICRGKDMSGRRNYIVGLVGDTVGSPSYMIGLA